MNLSAFILSDLLGPFHYQFMQRALLGCVLVGFTNGFLSAFIVLRQQALLADALSQAEQAFTPERMSHVH